MMPGMVASEGYFAASTKERAHELIAALRDKNSGAVICTRGGYGAAYLLDGKGIPRGLQPKMLLGYSDITALDAYLWEKFRWVTFYGPMIATDICAGADVEHGYDSASLRRALTQTRGGWALELEGESLAAGDAKGVILGGCLTLLETTIGTPWELDTRGAILLLEDRGVKPYQVDRMLTHLRQAGKFTKVRGLVWGEFPDCAPTKEGSPTVREIAHRICAPLRIPMVWGARIGHTPRPILTVPLGIRGRLRARGSGTLEILEPAVRA